MCNVRMDKEYPGIYGYIVPRGKGGCCSSQELIPPKPCRTTMDNLSDQNPSSLLFRFKFLPSSNVYSIVAYFRIICQQYKMPRSGHLVMPGCFASGSFRNSFGLAGCLLQFQDSCRDGLTSIVGKFETWNCVGLGIVVRRGWWSAWVGLKAEGS